MVCNHEKDNFEELHSRMLLWKRNFIFYYHLTTFSLFQMVRLFSKQLVNYFEFHKQAAWNSLPIWELIYIKFKQDLTLSIFWPYQFLRVLTFFFDISKFYSRTALPLYLLLTPVLFPKLGIWSTSRMIPKFIVRLTSLFLDMSWLPFQN